MHHTIRAHMHRVMLSAEILSPAMGHIITLWSSSRNGQFLNLPRLSIPNEEQTMRILSRDGLMGAVTSAISI
jgi:hypothetical protein